MKQKNYLVGLFFTLSSFAFVTVVKATNQWEPMVEIPGIPTTGINLSTYLVGLYNFMLSVVGIVAVMMLILAGMRYITSAGNQGAMTDAKSMAGNAIVGLLLALFSFVILKTINPDVLYLKKPGGTYGGGIALDLGACGRLTAGSCQCNDGSTPFAAVNQDVCHTECSDQDKCSIKSKLSCRGGGGMMPTFLTADATVERCFCASGAHIEPSAAAKVDTPTDPPDTCEQICGDITGTLGLKADGVTPSDYNGFHIVLKVGPDSNNMEYVPKTGFSVPSGIPQYYDFSESYDCNYGIVHLAIDFVGGLPGVPEAWCCMQHDVGCGVRIGGWGVICEIGGPGRNCDTWSQSIFGLPDYPVFQKTLNADSVFWYGLSIGDIPYCTTYEREDIHITVY